MKNIVRPLVLLVTAALLVLGFDLATYASNGDSLLLGRLNKAGKVTTIKRTSGGPVLALKGRPGAPPMTVSSTKKVARLNADLVDGFDASALQTRVTTYTMAPLPAGDFLRWNLPLAPGTYLTSWSAQLNGSTGQIVCGFADPSFADVPAAQMIAASGFTLDALSGSGVITTTAAKPFDFFCQSSAGSMTQVGGGVQVAVQKVDASTVASAPELVRPAPRRGLNR
ncbi:hypothetical protein [Nocardioides lijunqiniae]|uniref:hypothetical protein n=1 Tax=Nocardioides lijunqiniae TaxID=2760832 RepID=UPI0018787FF1|nr:hypothetical protein [Nocardioides lijunqiniae]